MFSTMLRLSIARVHALDPDAGEALPGQSHIVAEISEELWKTPHPVSRSARKAHVDQLAQLAVKRPADEATTEHPTEEILLDRR